MSTAVTVGGMEISSNHASADDMVEALTPSKEDSPQPRVTVEDGKPVKETDSEQDAVSKAASALGKKGGEAAAKARAAEAREAKKAEADAATAKDEKPQEAPEEKPLGKPRDDPRARMLEATRKEAEAKRELARERQEREAERQRYNAEIAAARQAPQAAPKAAPTAQGKPDQSAVNDDPAPREEDYQDYAAYIKDVASHSAREAHRGLQAQQQARAQMESRRQGIDHVWGKHLERVTNAGGEEFLAEFDPEHLALMKPTFALHPHETPGPINVITDEIIRSDHGPALMTYFRDNENEFQRIASLQDPVSVMREMAKLEYRIEAATAGNSPKASVSRATPPVRPVHGSPAIAEPDETETKSFEDFVRLRKAKKARASR